MSNLLPTRQISPSSHRRERARRAREDILCHSQPPTPAAHPKQNRTGAPSRARATTPGGTAAPEKTAPQQERSGALACPPPCPALPGEVEGAPAKTFALCSHPWAGCQGRLAVRERPRLLSLAVVSLCTPRPAAQHDCVPTRRPGPSAAAAAAAAARAAGPPAAGATSCAPRGAARASLRRPAPRAAPGQRQRATPSRTTSPCAAAGCRPPRAAAPCLTDCTAPPPSRARSLLAAASPAIAPPPASSSSSSSSQHPRCWAPSTQLPAPRPPGRRFRPQNSASLVLTAERPPPTVCLE